MDLMTAILACSLYRDDALVRAIAGSNSHSNPYALLDATVPADDAGQPPAPRSLGTALPAMQKIIEVGGEPLLGLMQIPSAWAAAHHKRPEDLFNPCTNIAVGTAKLSELEYECSRAAGVHRPATSRRTARVPPAGVRRCVAHKYAETIHQPEFELVVLLELEHGPPLRLASSNISTPILSHDRPALQFTEGALFFDVGRAPSSSENRSSGPFPGDALFEPPSPAVSPAGTPVQPQAGP